MGLSNEFCFATELLFHILTTEDARNVALMRFAKMPKERKSAVDLS